MTFRTTKTWGNERGFSCAFRQWRATHSHCSLLHGYSLGFKFIFETDELDDKNWGVDFGAMDSLKTLFQGLFDHTTVVASDDPNIEWFREGHAKGVLNLIEMPSVGCERFAELAYRATFNWMIDQGYTPRCRLVSVEVSEHGANSAVYVG
jgi:6-pyruvoyltetrahydropterin/6-carboxytetrahydropterin synthase